MTSRIIVAIVAVFAIVSLAASVEAQTSDVSGGIAIGEEFGFGGGYTRHLNDQLAVGGHFFRWSASADTLGVVNASGSLLAFGGGVKYYFAPRGETMRFFVGGGPEFHRANVEVSFGGLFPSSVSDTQAAIFGGGGLDVGADSVFFRGSGGIVAGSGEAGFQFRAQVGYRF